MGPFRTPRTPLALLWVLLPLAASAQQPRRADVLRGRVVSDSGLAVSGADVVVTMAPDRAERATRTDSAGRFEILLNGSGDYLVHVGGLGWLPWRKRVLRAGADTVLTVEVTLKAQAVPVAPITVNAERQKPTPGDEGPARTGIGAREDLVAGVNAAVPPTLQGDLNAMAATMPGVHAVPGGVSILGLPPAQNNATLYGMAFRGGRLPRDARSWTRVSSSTFDPTRGGFSGGQVAVELQPGQVFSGRRAHLTMDAPPLQYGDAVSRQGGQRFMAFQGSLGADGELVRDRYYYNVSGQLSRRSEEATTLLTADDAILGPAGVAPDSVARFLQLLSAAGVPARVGPYPTRGRLATSASFVARLDHEPDSARAWAVTAYADATGADAPVSPLATPTQGGSTRSGTGMVEGEYTLYFYKNYMNQTRSALTLTWDRAKPALRVADGHVLVTSDSNDRSLPAGGLASLAFGGNAGLDSDARSWTWETVDELQWYNRDSRHKFKLYASSRLDGYTRATRAGELGSYSYNSLLDFALGRPAVYSRLLSTPRSTSGEWSGVLALGDQFRSNKLALLYGARLEANRYTETPAPNPAVLATFGARTDDAPNTIHVSPRFGFSYSITGDENTGIATNAVATRITAPRGVVRGGIGEFRSLLAPDLLADAMVATGLPNASRRLLCVGPAVPPADWRALAGGAAPPAACADGADGFIDDPPAIQLFDRSYDAPRSWRVNLGWSGTALGLGLTLDGTYSLGLDQPGTVDLNFAGTPRFTLADEGGRPVYVSPGAIVPATGALSSVEARRARTFGAVLSRRSDLRGWARQVTATVSPGEGGISSKYFLAGAYTLAQSRNQWRGFGGSAFGDPRLRETAPGDYDIRHQIQVQAGYAWNRWLSSSLFGTVSSGRPFTPLVAGDVNGDGRSGDRAFIFDPAHGTDAALAAAMQTLLATGPGNIRDCLTGQLGQPARRNSCRGPWTTDLRAQVVVSGMPHAFGMHRVSAVLNLSNPLGGLDQLLHGGGSLRGWGAPAVPDPVLYQVRGFDPASQRFRYEVNPRFGDTRPSANTLRSPFRITLDISIDLGKPISQQQLERSLAPDHRMPIAAVRRMYARNVLDIYRRVLEQSDSLMLTPQQVSALREAQVLYRARMDSLWTDLATYLVALPRHYSGAAALKRQEDSIDQGWNITWKDAVNLRTVLSPVQLRMLPRIVAMLANSKECPKIRLYFAGQ